VLGWLPGCATRAVTWGLHTEGPVFGFALCRSHVEIFIILSSNCVLKVTADGTVDRAPGQRWRAQHLFRLFCVASIHAYLAYTLSVTELLGGLCSCTGSVCPRPCRQQQVLTAWRSHSSPCEPDLDAERGKWHSKEHEGPRNPVIIPSYPYYVLVWANHWYWTGWPRRKGKDGTAIVLPFQPLFILAPRECASIQKWNKTRWAAWGRVRAAP